MHEALNELQYAGSNMLYAKIISGCIVPNRQHHCNGFNTSRYVPTRLHMPANMFRWTTAPRPSLGNMGPQYGQYGVCFRGGRYKVDRRVCGRVCAVGRIQRIRPVAWPDTMYTQFGRERRLEVYI